MTIAVARIYDPPGDEAGARFLVDAMWPRGITKEQAALTVWLRAIAPSKEVRQRYHGQTEGNEEAWRAFVRDYHADLNNPSAVMSDAISVLKAAITAGRVTLLYAARNTDYNNAVALRQWIEYN